MFSKLLFHELDFTVFAVSGWVTGGAPGRWTTCSENPESLVLVIKPNLG